MRTWIITLSLSAAAIVAAGTVGEPTMAGVTVDDCVDQNYTPVPCKSPYGKTPFGGERPPDDGRCGTFGGFCCWCHVTVPANVGAPASLQSQVLTNPTVFWTRHDALARRQPPRPEHRAVRVRPGSPASYDALLRARRPPAR